jgi:hypothetical protein
VCEREGVLAGGAGHGRCGLPRWQEELRSRLGSAGGGARVLLSVGEERGAGQVTLAVGRCEKQG